MTARIAPLCFENGTRRRGCYALRLGRAHAPTRGRSKAVASIKFLADYCDGCSEWVVVVVEVAGGIVA